MDVARSLVEQARAALHAVAPERADELDQAWRRLPWSVGITGGDGPARAELVNLLCGERVLDPFDRRIGTAAVRLRRGERARYRAVHVDGSCEEGAFDPLPDPEREALAAHAREVREALAARETALVVAERGVPR